MRFLLFFLSLSLCAADFDCAVVGTSPFSLFEALYQSHMGKKVVIFEESEKCGGAWKGIDILGLCNVDLGCHQIGNDQTLKTFLEEYAGCTIVSMDQPDNSFENNKGPNGWYFSSGCFELIDHLLKLIDATDIVLMTETKLDSAFLDEGTKTVALHTKKGVFTSSKLIVTNMSSLSFNTLAPPNHSKSKYYHLYLLVQDPTPARFTYRAGIGNGSSRLMNLTPFVDLVGRHLIVVQTHNEKSLEQGEVYLTMMKEKNLVDQSAYILKEERYIYETGALRPPQRTEMVEILQTGHFQSLSNYIPKWKTVLKPYQQALGG